MDHREKAGPSRCASALSTVNIVSNNGSLIIPLPSKPWKDKGFLPPPNGSTQLSNPLLTMKKLLVITLLNALMSTTILANSSHDHATDHKPMHGGLYDRGAFDFELVVKQGEVKLYVTDHGQAVGLAGATASLTILEGNKKFNLELRPGSGFFTGKLGKMPAKGAKAVVQMKIDGKSSTARFTF